jgi:hypothetical protein
MRTSTLTTAHLKIQGREDTTAAAATPGTVPATALGSTLFVQGHVLLLYLHTEHDLRDKGCISSLLAGPRPCLVQGFFHTNHKYRAPHTKAMTSGNKSATTHCRQEVHLRIATQHQDEASEED